LITLGDEAAILAVKLYAYRIKKFIGSYTAVLNGIDAIIFTAGVGENDVDMRKAVCEELDYLGISLDETKNTGYSGLATDISVAEAKVRILVIPTNEEFEIANQCFSLIK
jgi:acetate kinase